MPEKKFSISINLPNKAVEEDRQRSNDRGYPQHRQINVRQVYEVYNYQEVVDAKQNEASGRPQKQPGTRAEITAY
jgi:hypothetical protein